IRDDELRAGVYIDMLDRLAPEMREVLERAVDAVERPLLFHCAAGKDRTGVIAAVLLGVLGVAEADIVEDYELTTDHYGGGGGAGHAAPTACPSRPRTGGRP